MKHEIHLQILTPSTAHEKNGKLSRIEKDEVLHQCEDLEEAQEIFEEILEVLAEMEEESVDEETS